MEAPYYRDRGYQNKKIRHNARCTVADIESSDINTFSVCRWIDISIPIKAVWSALDTEYNVG